MISRQATVIVSDELLISLTGKVTILGAYTGDIKIMQEPTTVAQLVFLFIIETSLEDPYRNLTVQVTFPEAEPVRQDIPIGVVVSPERTRWISRWPLLIPQPILRPGRIDAKLFHEQGELTLAAPWIVMGERATALSS